MRNIKILGLVALVALLLSGCQKEPPMKAENPATTESTSQQTRSNPSDQPTKASDIRETRETVEGTVVSNPESVAPMSLIKSVQEQNLNQVKKIMETPGYPIDEVDGEGNTPLNIAVHQNQVEIGKILIDHGADINHQNNIKDSPYLYAGAEGKSELLAYMLSKQKVDTSKVNRFGGNALIPAAEKGHIDTVKILLAQTEKQVNFQNNFGYTALIEVVAFNDGSQTYQDIARLLLANGADKGIKDNSGLTAMDYARNKNLQQMIEILK